VRRFGVLKEQTTPCGKKLSITQAHALMILLEAEKSSSEIRQQELVKELNIDKSNVARLCQKMTDVGHIVQKRSDLDARSWQLGLTSRGLKMAQQLEDSSLDRFSRLLESIPEDQRGKVIASLRILSEAMDSL
jgi:DNA-binding MarR family transcriptional regulator